jgi:hypothetical protein
MVIANHPDLVHQRALCNRRAGRWADIEQDAVRVNHRHTVEDLVRLGAEVEQSFEMATTPLCSDCQPNRPEAAVTFSDRHHRTHP